MPHEKNSTGHPTPLDTRTVLKGMVAILIQGQAVRLTGGTQSFSTFPAHFNGVSHASLTALVPEI